MGTHRKEILCNESLDEIRQELSQTDLSGVSDEEYISLLTKHTSNLVTLLERINEEVEIDERIESVLSILFENLHEPVCAVDNHAQVIYYNACWKRSFINTRLKHALSESLPSHKSELLDQTIKLAQYEGKRMIYTLQSDTGRNFISIMPIRDFQGQQNFLVTFIGDEVLKQLRVNGYKNSDDAKELRISAEKQGHYKTPPDFHEMLLESIDGFYFILSGDNTFHYLSPSITKKFGYSAEELTGKHIKSVFSETSCRQIEEFISTKLFSGSSSGNQSKIEVEVIDRNQEIKTYELTLSRHKNSNRLAGVCIDIHSHKVREQELIAAKNVAKLNDKLKSVFLANMSHEIRTPLNGIIGFSSMLDREDLQEDKREKYLRIIRSSSGHLLTLVSDIIDISKIEARQLKIISHKVDVHQMLEDIQSTFIAEAKRLGNRNIRFIKQIGKPNSALYIRSDEVRLRQVLNNLLGNALKFTNEGNILFGYSIIDSDTIRFFVRDNGIGISKSAQKSIFNRFKQTNEGEKDKYKGTGLGLAISKGIIDLMGGKIGVLSQHGKGSEFFFTLPLTK